MGLQQRLSHGRQNGTSPVTISLKKLQRVEKRKSSDKTDCSLPTKFARNSSGSKSAESSSSTSCFFCDDASGTLHQASKFNMDAKVRQCALQLEDSVLLAKLSAGDLISQEAVYHSKCLVALYNRARNDEGDAENRDKMVFQGIALARLVEYIEETRAESVDTIPVFKLAELTQI